MGFKLGKERGLQVGNGEIKNKMSFNKDNISISEQIQPGSKEEREVLIHEMRHATDMRIGKLKYEDDYIEYNGEQHERKEINGEDMINYDGKWVQAGSTEFPWELEANNGNK